MSVIGRILFAPLDAKSLNLSRINDLKSYKIVMQNGTEITGTSKVGFMSKCTER